MGVLVVIGLVGVFLLWRILGTQQQRAQIEAAKFVLDTTSAALRAFEQRHGTIDNAMRAGRLIDYYEAMARELGLSDEDIATVVHRRDNAVHLRSLLVESIDQAKKCRFLDNEDYASTETHYPGPQPQPEKVCSEYCDESAELSYLPQDAETCPFCGRPMGLLGSVASFDRELAEWRVDDQAWQLWKKFAPGKAREAEAEWRRANERTLAQDRAEFDAALLVHHSRK